MFILTNIFDQPNTKVGLKKLYPISNSIRKGKLSILFINTHIIKILTFHWFAKDQRRMVRRDWVFRKMEARLYFNLLHIFLQINLIYMTDIVIN